MKEGKDTIPMWAIRLDFERNLSELGAKEMNKRLRLCMAFLRSHEEHSMMLGAKGEKAYFWMFLDKAVRDGVLEEASRNETLKDAFEIYCITDMASVPKPLFDRLYGKELHFKGD